MFFCGFNFFFRPFQTALPLVRVERAECTQGDFIICLIGQVGAMVKLLSSSSQNAAYFWQ